MDPERIRQTVRDSYAKLADPGAADEDRAAQRRCCETNDVVSLNSIRLGYAESDLRDVPRDADMGLGCGNPHAIADLRAGETVLDLGSGGGLDAFLAAQQVGEQGRVIGVDMTPEMISKAGRNAQRAGHRNVEFRLGEIERLPVEDACIDVIISNCVVNLSPDKPRVFGEAFRVLKPGGRLAISDVLATTGLPPELQADARLHVCCVAGAIPVAALRELLVSTGFEDIAITPKDDSREFIRDWVPGSGVEDYVVSAYIRAVKPV